MQRDINHKIEQLEHYGFITDKEKQMILLALENENCKVKFDSFNDREGNYHYTFEIVFKRDFK